ncbi:MAG: hypothetical protein HN715_07640 [Rhodobiaceae bacterium]|jgi:hypothetical protein|nr:hypothetical protein [Rhodobiaceae bacterium]
MTSWASSLKTRLRAAVWSLALLCLLPGSSFAQDWQLLQLSARSQHQGSKVWSGRFHGLNGTVYNATEFYQPTRPQFSASGLLALPRSRGLTWLVPISVDAGYSAKLYQARPLASLGFGAAVRLGPHSLVSFRVDNILVAGGKVSEQPCFDSFRRRFHCGSGLAWTEFETTRSAKRKSGGGAGQLGEPSLHAKWVHKFSF